MGISSLAEGNRTSRRWDEDDVGAGDVRSSKCSWTSMQDGRKLGVGKNMFSQPAPLLLTFLLALIISSGCVSAEETSTNSTTTGNGTNSTNATHHEVDSGSIVAGSNPLSEPVGFFIVQTAIILVTARLFYIPVQYFRQPRVVAEVLAGILLGPSVISRNPNFRNNIFTAGQPVNALDMVGQFGLVFFLFLVGLELDPQFFVKNVKKSVVICVAGFSVPFLASIGAAKLIHDQYGSSDFGILAVFVAAILSITTFPDIARIVTERKLQLTPLGQLTLSSAAVDDVGAWVFLLFVISLVNNVAQPITALYIFLVMVSYTAFLWFLARPQMVKWADLTESSHSISEIFVFVVLALVLVSAFFTEALGASAMFGGFLIGVIVPHNHSFAINLLEKLEDLINIFFLPIYFFYSGFHTQLDLLNTGTAWGIVFLCVAIGSIGKIVGAGLASRFLNNMGWRESLAIGVLMNTKGFLEFVVLNLGYQSRIINPTVFTILIVSALISNILTIPLISIVYPYSLYLDKDAIPKRKVFRKGGLKLEEASPTTDSGKEKKESEVKDSSMTLEKSDMYEVGGVSTASTSSANPFENELNMLTYLPNLQSLPAMMVLTEMLRVSEVPMHVTALRLIRLSERNSTILMATDTDSTLRADAVALIFTQFATLLQVGNATSLVVSALDEFPDHIARTAAAQGSNLILLPWKEGSGETTANPALADLHGAVDEGLRNAVIEGVYRKAECTVVVLLDRGFGSLQSPASPIRLGTKWLSANSHKAGLKKPVAGEEEPETPAGQPLRTYSVVIDAAAASAANNGDGSGTAADMITAPQRLFVLFFGGRDDLEALNLVVLLAKANVNVTLIRLRVQHDSDDHNKHKDHHHHHESSATATGKEPAAVGGNPKDDAALEAAINKMKAVGCLVVLQDHTTSVPGAKLQELHAAGEVGSTGADLVVMGHSTYASISAVAHWADSEINSSVVTVRAVEI